MTGLKCYHTMAPLNPRLGTDESDAGSYTAEDPTWTAPIEAYLPEDHVVAANTLGLTITLHMVRDRALADPVNQVTIRRYCESYPNMKLILAHAARGFNPWHTIEGIESLRGLDNVWFDTSAVTEAGAFEAIVETMGHEKLMYGTDFHVSQTRGRCVAIGDSFHWLYADEMDLDEKHISLAACPGRPRISAQHPPRLRPAEAERAPGRGHLLRKRSRPSGYSVRRRIMQVLSPPEQIDFAHNKALLNRYRFIEYETLRILAAWLAWHRQHGLETGDGSPAMGRCPARAASLPAPA